MLNSMTEFTESKRVQNLSIAQMVTQPKNTDDLPTQESKYNKKKLVFIFRKKREENGQKLTKWICLSNKEIQVEDSIKFETESMICNA